MICAVCGQDLQSLENGCPKCASGNHTLQPQTGHYGVKGNPRGMLFEPPLESTEGRLVDFKPATGGRLIPTRIQLVRLRQICPGRSFEAVRVRVGS